MEKLVQKVVFGKTDKERKDAIIRIIKTASKKGIWLESTQKLYEEIAKGNCKGFTVPAINIRTLTFDFAKAIFRAAHKEDVGAFIFEIAASEINYTSQSLEEYIAVILAAGIEERFRGPIFFQGDHFKVNVKKYLSKDKEQELKKLKDLVKEAIKTGFYNIDIDCSGLKNVKENSYLTSELTYFIRKIQPEKITISIGGEIGQIGDKDTTVKELEIFMDEYQKYLSKYGKLKGVSKIAVQARTCHGGVILASGKLKEVKEDFPILKKLSRKAREYNTAGIVQHGASTLSKKHFSHFPESEVCEIHLATNFQNIIYESSYFPKHLKKVIYDWIKKEFLKEREETDTEIQFLYKLRKKALGPFKKAIWDIPKINKDKISGQLEKEFIFLFKALKVCQTKKLIKEIYSKKSRNKFFAFS
jgi:fructose/tagatose bisphosphate aldolase